jgi:poly [ADP-ribose] polymerase
VVPLGKPVPTGTSNTSLLYNEFIVYDVAQLLIKYLVVVEFKY